MRWNLRMTAAERGIWKSTEMRRRLAEAGLEVSAGKMSRWWTTTPVSIRLEDLDDLRRAGVHPRGPYGLRAGQGRRLQAAHRSHRHETGSGAAAGPAQIGAASMSGVIKNFCQACGVRPPAMREIPCCFECWPGGPVTPPPCRRCGSKENYYTSGLCARCHHHAPGPKSPRWESPGKLRRRPVKVASCPDAWRGASPPATGGCAWPANPGERSTAPTASAPPAADRSRSARTGCRLCDKHRNLAARLLGRRIETVTLAVANVYGQQLFIAGTWRPAGTIRRDYVKKTIPADMSLLCPVTYRQLLLFDMPRDLRLGLWDKFAATGPGAGGRVRPIRPRPRRRARLDQGLHVHHPARHPDHARHPGHARRADPP